MKFRLWLVDHPGADPYRQALIAAELIDDDAIRAFVLSSIREQALHHYYTKIIPLRGFEDPIERVVQKALEKKKIPFTMNFPRAKEKGEEIDFVLANSTKIEVKRFYSPRSDLVLKKNKNILLIQGQQAAIEFDKMLNYEAPVSRTNPANFPNCDQNGK